MKVDTETIKRLHAQHVERYSKRIEAAKRGSQHVRVTECEYYLGLWKGMAAKEFNLDRFSQAERMELYDALDDEGLA